MCLLVRIILIMILFVPLSSGCVPPAPFVYPPGPEKGLVRFYQEPKYPLRVAVVPFMEKRGEKFEDHSLHYLIPFVLWGRLSCDRPGSEGLPIRLPYIEFNPCDDLAEAAVVSLRRSGLFEDVFLARAEEENNADAVISGEILSTDYVGKTYSYGLSFVGTYLWFIGLPAGSSRHTLKLRLFLEKKGVPGTLWRYELSREQTIIQGMYYNRNREEDMYAVLMEEGMNEAVRELDRTLAAAEQSQ